MTTSVLSACQIFAKCANDPKVLQLLQKCFVRIKNSKTNYSNQSRKPSTKLKKKTSNNNYERRKIN